jgi:succinyl-CoA synthetase beta subunit
MQEFGVRVQRGDIASTPEEVQQVAQQLKDTKAEDLVMKAQIHAGGRGKGHFLSGYKGGVKVRTTVDELVEISKSMLGGHLVTKQTGAEGQLCSKVYIVEGLDFEGITELYIAFLMDRTHNGPVCVASTQGGMDIEEVAESTPEAIVTVPIDITTGITQKEVDAILKALKLDGDKDAGEQITNLYKMFIETDCSQVEINPFVRTKDGRMWCVDAKLNIDDNANYRQQRLFDMRDFSMEDPREVAAAKHNLNYIGLDGSIGCMVNGAGLAMATMDIINLHGGKPANFLDVGGGATEAQVEQAFRILNDDPSVKAILVNIFGGIMKCDVIAQGIVNAALAIDLKLPLVVRLEGTNVELGNEILKKSGIKLATAGNLDEAAIKAVAAIR